MKKFLTVLIIMGAMSIALPAYAGYGNGYENDELAPAAFIDGTANYTIKFFDNMRGRLGKRLDLDGKQFMEFDAAIAQVKNENAALAAKILTLKSQHKFLEAGDPAFLHYRETLAKTTDAMFVLMRKLSASTPIPSR